MTSVSLNNYLLSIFAFCFLFISCQNSENYSGLNDSLAISSKVIESNTDFLINGMEFSFDRSPKYGNYLRDELLLFTNRMDSTISTLKSNTIVESKLLTKILEENHFDTAIKYDSILHFMRLHSKLTSKEISLRLSDFRNQIKANTTLKPSINDKGPLSVPVVINELRVLENLFVSYVGLLIPGRVFILGKSYPIIIADNNVVKISESFTAEITISNTMNYLSYKDILKINGEVIESINGTYTYYVEDHTKTGIQELDVVLVRVNSYNKRRIETTTKYNYYVID